MSTEITNVKYMLIHETDENTYTDNNTGYLATIFILVTMLMLVIGLCALAVLN